MMQISPVPNTAWSNPAAASQQASETTRSTSASPSSSAGAPRTALEGVERSSEILERDANGQYDGSGADPRREDSNPEQPLQNPSLLDLPVASEGDPSTLDLIG
jgi:hypothetical protein